jgi:hypothetical protein
MAAAAGATGVRSWLQIHHTTWLTPRRMKAATVGLFALALAVSSIGLSGSSSAQHPAHPHPAAQHPAAQHPAAQHAAAQHAAPR